MSKKDFIALADAIRYSSAQFTDEQLNVLARFCQAQNTAFKRERWLEYIAGKCGPNGGIKDYIGDVFHHALNTEVK